MAVVCACVSCLYVLRERGEEGYEQSCNKLITNSSCLRSSPIPISPLLAVPSLILQLTVANRWPGDCVQIWRRAAKSSRWTQRPSDHGQIRRQEAKSGQVDAAFGRAAAYEGSTMAAPLARRAGGEARRRRPQAKLLGRRGRREAQEQLVAGDGTSVSATAREEGMVWGIGTA